MEVLVVADGHYYRDSKGEVYVQSVFDYNFYKRYLMSFDKVYAAVRIENVDKVPEGKKKASGEGVEFLELPAYTGPFEYIKKYFTIRKAAKEICKAAPCGIFRLPGASVNLMCSLFARTKKPFAVEIVIDPWENFAPGSMRSIVRPIVRVSWTEMVKKMCRRAIGASYVTEKYLQKLYPCTADIKPDGKHFTSFYSSVELPDDSFAEPKHFEKKDKWVISHVSNSFTDYGKGHMQLIKALSAVREKGYDVSAWFIGDGPKKQEYTDYAKSLGVSENVSFLGRLPMGSDVRRVIHDSDMFVFPTRAEGLPRVLLEAMSEGLPCLSCPTCGIPEILDSEYLFDYEDTDGFANAIVNFIENPDKMEKASKENIKTAKKYASSILDSRRKKFYDSLKNAAENAR